VTLPSPAALRLVTTARGRAPKPPFGLKEWSATGDALALLLEARGGDDLSAAEVAAQLPAASTLPSGAAVWVLGTAASDGALWRLFGRGSAVSRAARCSALVARGYVDVGAGAEGGADLAWGRAP
jgi:hypothetical protein